jgi:uncharacterized protein
MSESRTLIESMVAAFNRGDIPYILGQFADDSAPRETRSPELPYVGNFTGPQGAGKFFELMGSVLQPTKLDIDRWVCEGEYVVAMGSWAGTAHRTGKSFDSDLALYFRVRNGKVIEFRGHDDTAVTAAALRS